MGDNLGFPADPSPALLDCWTDCQVFPFFDSAVDHLAYAWGAL
jgi:hypothetical protein